MEPWATSRNTPVFSVLQAANVQLAVPMDRAEIMYGEKVTAGRPRALSVTWSILKYEIIGQCDRAGL